MIINITILFENNEYPTRISNNRPLTDLLVDFRIRNWHNYRIVDIKRNCLLHKRARFADLAIEDDAILSVEPHYTDYVAMQT